MPEKGKGSQFEIRKGGYGHGKKEKRPLVYRDYFKEGNGAPIGAEPRGPQPRRLKISVGKRGEGNSICSN